VKEDRLNSEENTGVLASGRRTPWKHEECWDRSRPQGSPLIDSGLTERRCQPSSQILVTLMMEALGSSETSVLTRATRRNIAEGGILHSHRRENLESYIALTGWTL
jgi:hypothetical protein